MGEIPERLAVELVQAGVGHVVGQVVLVVEIFRAEGAELQVVPCLPSLPQRVSAASTEDAGDHLAAVPESAGLHSDNY